MRTFMRLGPSFSALVAILTLLGAVGCGSGSDRLKKQVKQLETEVTALRADADRLEERLEAMELNAAVAARARKDEPPRQERPRLKVIHLSPDDEAPAAPKKAPAEPSDASDDPESRPVIRGTGDRVIKTGEASPSGRMDATPNTVLVAQHVARGRVEN